MPLTKAQGKRLRLGESGDDRPAERLFLYRATQFDAMCDGGQSPPRVQGVFFPEIKLRWRQRQPSRGQSGVRHVTYL